MRPWRQRRRTGLRPRSSSTRPRRRSGLRPARTRRPPALRPPSPRTWPTRRPSPQVTTSQPQCQAQRLQSQAPCSAGGAPRARATGSPSAVAAARHQRAGRSRLRTAPSGPASHNQTSRRPEDGHCHVNSHTLPTCTTTRRRAGLCDLPGPCGS